MSLPKNGKTESESPKLVHTETRAQFVIPPWMLVATGAFSSIFLPLLLSGKLASLFGAQVPNDIYTELISLTASNAQLCVVLTFFALRFLESRTVREHSRFYDAVSWLMVGYLLGAITVFAHEGFTLGPPNSDVPNMLPTETPYPSG
jgi:hypothetical protein